MIRFVDEKNAIGDPHPRLLNILATDISYPQLNSIQKIESLLPYPKLADVLSDLNNQYIRGGRWPVFTFGKRHAIAIERFIKAHRHEMQSLVIVCQYGQSRSYTSAEALSSTIKGLVVKKHHTASGHSINKLIKQRLLTQLLK